MLRAALAVRQAWRTYGPRFSTEFRYPLQNDAPGSGCRHPLPPKDSYTQAGSIHARFMLFLLLLLELLKTRNRARNYAFLRVLIAAN